MEATITSTLSRAAEGARDLYEEGLNLIYPDAALKATFSRLDAPAIPRSSHTLNVVGNRAFIFGGEISPRQPVDASMNVITLPSGDGVKCGHEVVEAKGVDGGKTPDARVGHSSATIGKTIYVFGGRGGPSMSALDEHGAIWAFSTTALTWNLLEPAQGSPTPEPRSYHTMTATPFPAPISTPNITNVLLNETPDPTKDLATTPAENTYGTIFLHAGCLSSGGRTSDLWSFDVASRTWAQLPSAPEPARGGTSLTMIRDRLYRFGGFNGKTEEGGQIDYLDLNLLDQFSDEGGEGLMAVSPRGEWASILMTAGSDDEGSRGVRTGPTYRSVAGFVPVSVGAGRDYLLMICGEGQASTAGHAAAGKFLNDIWSFKPKVDTSSSVAGRQSAQGTFKEVEYQTASSSSSEQEKPLGRRGWFAASEYDGKHVVVWGGIGEDNERLGDGWLVTVG